MNHLNRIILINSANTPYREVRLDGHIHFIGTQGTGKSTLLRAILFFYNAESRKLGLSKEKKSFADFYFPHRESYIVYEVKKGQRIFCVWLAKRKNILAFRFIDGPYQPDFFITKNRANLEEEILHNYRGENMEVSRAITNFSNYRDILYGAVPEMRRYRITQNKAYQNIPRTISNIFLNSSLDATFIKQTIIHSLSDDPFEINLDTNRYHLEKAQQDFRDVEAYLKHSKAAQNIVERYEELLDLEKQRKEMAWQTGGAYNHSVSQKKLKEQDLLVVEEKVKGQEEKIARIKEEHQTKLNNLKGNLATTIADIKRANAKRKSYAEQNIKGILEEKSHKNQYEQEKLQLENQITLLTREQQDIETAFLQGKARLQNDTQTRVLTLQDQAGKKREALRDYELNLEKQHLSNENTLKEEYRERLSAPHNKINELKQELFGFKIKGEHLSKKLFLNTEQQKIKEEIERLNQKSRELEGQIGQAKQEKKTLQTKGEAERQKLNYHYRDQIRPLMAKKEKLNDQIARLKKELANLKGSLLEFLESNYPNWQNTIGKTANRELLLSHSLKPFFSQGNSLYGLTLDLTKRQPLSISKTELEKELEKNEQERGLIQKDLIRLQQEEATAQQRLTKKYNRLVLEQEEQKRKARAQVQQYAVDIEKAILRKAESQREAEKLKQEALANLNEELLLLEQKIKEEQQEETRLEEQMDRQLEQDKKLFTKKIRETQKSLKDIGDQAKKEIALLQSNLTSQISELETRRNEALSQKGVDTKKLKELEKRRDSFMNKLANIEANSRLIIEYEKDYREYIARLPEFQKDRKDLEQQVEHRQHLFDKRFRDEQQILDHEKEARNTCLSAIHSHQSHIEAMEQFRSEALYTEMKSFLEHHDTYAEEGCKELLYKLHNVALECEKKSNSLGERITAFAGYFNEENCLSFITHLTTQTEIRAFAENLMEFVHKQKILDFQTEVTRKYAQVLELVVKETNELLQKEQDIDNVVRRINKDFKQSNFVGVVRSIEMRLQESNNKVIQILRKIRDFQEQNMMSFGELNLFNQVGSQTNDKDAVHLLEILNKRIMEYKTNSLKLEDAFELEFRIRENENDTQWVSRLSNVGSNGTDVLVKSMIYINMLNIFKKNGNKSQEEMHLHCLVDEVGILHDSNVKGLINFAAQRNIWLINGSPNSHNEQDYKHIYIFRKDAATNHTNISKLISNEI